MQIQVNSDKNIKIDTQAIGLIGAEANRALKRFAGRLTRVEVHLSDVNSHKFGARDKRCLIEARPARHQALAASSQAATVKEAVEGALGKLRRSLQTFFGRIGTRRDDNMITKATTAKPDRPPMRLRSARATKAAASARTGTDGDNHEAKAVKASPVASKRSSPDERLIHARGPKKKGIYQARRKSWPAR